MGYERHRIGRKNHKWLGYFNGRDKIRLKSEAKYTSKFRIWIKIKI